MIWVNNKLKKTGGHSKQQYDSIIFFLSWRTIIIFC